MDLRKVNIGIQKDKQRGVKILKLSKKVEDFDLPRLEEDFKLESGEDVKEFLRGPLNSKPNSKFSSVNLPSKESRSTKPLLASRPRMPTIYKLPTLGEKETHEVRLQQKLQAIEEGKSKEKAQLKEKLRNLNIGQRIVSQREEKTLENFTKTQNRWSRIERNLSKLLNKDKGDLLSNRAYEFREKIEEIDFLDRQIPTLEKAGDRIWYLTLRENKSDIKLGTLRPIGSMSNPIYAKCIERRRSAEPIIRKEGASKTTGKTFRDGQFYQTRMNSHETNHSIRPNPFIEANELMVIGVPKLPMELEALKTVGVDQLDLSAFEEAEEEEVYAQNYDPVTWY